jgi:P-type conjugative transfer protein TrbJ
MKKIIVAVTSLVLIASIGNATLPVVDFGAIAQAVQQTLKQVQQYSQQVSAYQLQLLQYKNQLVNTLGIGSTLQLWQQAQQTMGSVMGVVGIFKNGNIQSTLSQYQNVNYWLQAPPTAYTNQTNGSVLQKQANDAMFKGLAAQTQQIQTDAANLQKLQSQAGSAAGQMQALTAANELAALEQQQLLQIRALLVQEQQALVARNATSSNQEAMQQAATQKFFQATITTESANGWHP